jgi:hypothetical protein
MVSNFTQIRVFKHFGAKSQGFFRLRISFALVLIAKFNEGQYAESIS